MRRILLLIFSSVFFVLSSIGQERDSIFQIGLPIISQVNQGNSYITFPIDIGNIESLWFEGNIIPNFYLRQSKNSRLMGVLTPQIIIRMYQEESFPVRTPSYIPQVTIYYLLSEKERSRTTSLFGRIEHNSNGQEGDFYLENGEINLKSGNFSTNLMEVGLIKTNRNPRLNAFQFLKTSIEFQPKSWLDENLVGQYSRFRWHNAFSIFKLPQKNIKPGDKRAALSVKGEATLMFGDTPIENPSALDRTNLSLTVFYHPIFWEDLGLFVQLYHGMDYYNIYFNHQLDIIRFG
ncbi:MAG: hypothetical protein JXR34_13710, partial [Bacteroidales bacterium]|nr:hypothetical protein [Bacteroidales bacterium]